MALTSAIVGILDDKVTVVTGAARGIGRATLEVFLEEGARVVATDVDGDALSRTAAATGCGTDRLVTVVGDVSVEADAEAMIKIATQTWGRLDCLVANAGVIPLSTIDQTTVDDWDRVMAVDGRGMFLTCRAALRVMAEQGSGSIVNLSSISGLAGQAGQAAYGPAKFVATGITKHLAVEWAARGIRVNAVAPGTIRTDAARRVDGHRVWTPLRGPDGGAAPDGSPGRSTGGGSGNRIPRFGPS
jgi:NAD(P)-dependent dehydrogenase (short-subunit alcohol dehydrogenase family)